MKAFYNDPAIKQLYLDRVTAHEKADEIIKGAHWQNGKGCAVGCTIHSGLHLSYETELGIPEVLAQLEDYFFEGLSNEEAKTWPRRFLSAIKVGADLSQVWPKFAIFLLTDPSQCNSLHPQCDIVAKAYQDQLDKIEVDWGNIAHATRVAARAAASTTATAGATRAAINTAVNAAADTVYAAVKAAAYAANAAYIANTADTAYIAQAKKLLQLLEEAK